MWAGSSRPVSTASLKLGPLSLLESPYTQHQPPPSTTKKLHTLKPPPTKLRQQAAVNNKGPFAPLSLTRYSTASAPSKAGMVYCDSVQQVCGQKRRHKFMALEEVDGPLCPPKPPHQNSLKAARHSIHPTSPQISERKLLPHHRPRPTATRGRGVVGVVEDRGTCVKTSPESSTKKLCTRLS
jgi:hypothetical protein